MVVVRRRVVVLPSTPMLLIFFSSRGWESWDVEAAPLVPEGMPVLVDDDLRFEDGSGCPRPAAVVNRWLRELPACGVPAPRSWAAYARAVKDWVEFLAGHGIDVFGPREQLKLALGKYAEDRSAGPVERRLAASTWSQHMSIVSMFYRWAMAEGHALAEPFTYRTAKAMVGGMVRDVRVNLAMRRTPKPHVTIKYLEADFVTLLLNALAGLDRDGQADAGYAGRELARNRAVVGLALATGLRLQEFSSLLVYEIPTPPSRPGALPVPFPVPSGVAKGRKFRTSWISVEALRAVHDYVTLDRAAAVEGASWCPPARWGPALRVSEPDRRGGRINGVRRDWDALTPGERRRLVAPDGGSCLLAVRSDGGPFTAWATVLERASDRVRARVELRFPHVHPHRLRHSFAMAMLERLVDGHYRRAAELVAAGGESGPDAALALYLSKADPLLVLRDLMGHSSVTTTEAYLRRLDTTRIFGEAYARAGAAAGLADDPAADTEALAEFTDEPGGDD
ncbi:site-specific integrase [Frankia sp. B2]|nr:site-specific integrase [Frankia sp. B2]